MLCWGFPPFIPRKKKVLIFYQYYMLSIILSVLDDFSHLRLIASP